MSCGDGTSNGGCARDSSWGVAMLNGCAIGVIALACGFGCRPTAPAVPSPHQLVGQVLASDGSPVADSVVILTSISTTDEIAMARTDARGRFAFETPTQELALTAATSRGWAFIPKVDRSRGAVAVSLDPTCSQLRGAVKLDDADSVGLDVIRVGRLGKSVGDMFGATVRPDRTFELCLPPAEYYITLPKSFVERTILTKVPSDGPVEVRTVSRRRAAAAPDASHALSPSTLAAFVDGVPRSIRLLGLAESNHGAHEFTRERTKLAIALAQKRQFQVIMLEAGYGQVLALNDYIHGVNHDAAKILAGVGYWIWNTTALLEALDELREYNRSAPADRRISMVGVDVQSTSAAIDDLVSTIGASLADADAQLLARLREREGRQWRELSQEDRQRIRPLLQKLASARSPGGLATNRHALSAQSILLRLDLLEAQGFWSEHRVRDNGIATMATSVLGLEPDMRATLWAHLGHLSREWVVGCPTAGAQITKTLGDAYRVYALLAYAGTSRALDPKSEGGPTPHALTAAPAHSVEGALASSVQGVLPDISYWDFKQASAASLKWLHELRWVRSFGAAYPGDQASFEIYDLDAMDGAILFKSVTATERMPRKEPPP